MRLIGTPPRTQARAYSCYAKFGRLSLCRLKANSGQFEFSPKFGILSNALFFGLCKSCLKFCDKIHHNFSEVDQMLMIRTALISLLGLAAPAAFATTSIFDVTYNGTTASVTAGSDSIDGTSLGIGDGFNLTVSAAGNDYWSVNTLFDNVFVPLDFLVSESGTRTVDVVSRFFLDGALVKEIAEASVIQSFIHAGANFWTLETGLIFDQIAMDYVLLGSDNPTTLSAGSEVFASFGSPGAPFYNSPNITYVEAAAVPLPAGLPLLLVALGAIGLVKRGRHLA
jgi:hypothetical protein